jgi:hypothetical protein
MCGLVAVINKLSNGFTQRQKDLFNTLLFVDMLRGNDSTGVFAVSNRGNVITAKEASNSVDFMRHTDYTKLMNVVYGSGSAMVGHNRKATKGDITDENAHPFIVGENIVLVHNGTMWGDHKQHANVDVDSHAIAHLIHEKEDIAEALGQFHGAYALIWYDFAAGKLHFIRNSQRPLWWVELQDCWVFSSEREMLEFALNRCNVNYVKEGPHLLAEHVLQTYALREYGGWNPSSETIEPKRPVVETTYDEEGDGRWERWALGYDAAWEDFKKRFAEENGDATVVQAGLFPGARTINTEPYDPKTQSRLKDGRVVTIQTAINLEREEPFEPSDLAERERRMARKMNRKVTNRVYTSSVLPSYQYNAKHTAVAFDYGYVNGQDAKGGFYLYMNPVDDPDVFVRTWFSPSTTEEQMIQIAGCEYVYEFRVGIRSFSPLDEHINPRDVNDDTVGFVVIRAREVQLLAGADRSSNPAMH